MMYVYMYVHVHVYGGGYRYTGRLRPGSVYTFRTCLKTGTKFSVFSEKHQNNNFRKRL